MILGLMPIADDYRLTTACAIHFSKYVDHLVFRYDVIGGYDFDNTGKGGKFHRDFFKANEHMFHCEVEHFDAGCKRRGFQFMSDFNPYLEKYKPELIFECDSDEMLPEWDGFWDDIDRFRKRDKQICKFRGNWVINGEDRGGVYSPHCKVVKYEDGMAYGKNGMDPTYKKRGHGAHLAKSRYTHYNYFTHEMRQERVKYLINRAEREGRMWRKLFMTFKESRMLNEWKEEVLPLYPEKESNFWLAKYEKAGDKFK